MEPMDFVRECPPFDLLGEAELARVAATLEAVRLGPGTRLLAEGGERSRHIQILRQGELVLTKGEETLRVLGPGDLFGYPSLLSSSPPALDVTAATEVEVYRVPESTVRELLDVPEFSDYFLKSLGQRLRLAVRQERLGTDRNLAAPIRDLVDREPLFVEGTATVREAAQAMLEARTSSTLVAGEPIGIVTDRDLSRRVLAVGRSPETPVGEIASRPLKTLDSDSTASSALLYMLEEGIHHLALVEEGKVLGVLTSTDLLRHQSRNPVYLQRRLLRAHDAEELAGYTGELSETVRTLFRGGLGIIEIGRIVSSLNDALVKRLLDLAEERSGPPPCPYAWIVFGSEGRQEQALVTDQDNALVYATAGNGEARYFQALAEQVGAGLAIAGFPPCRGGYTADRWNRPLAEWERRFRRWIETPDPQALMDAANFFDFRAVHGGLSLEPLELALSGAREHGIFLGHLVREAQGFGVPLNLFNRIRAEDDGTIDLKSGGIAPIVGLARALALAAGSRERSTLERLAVASRLGTLSGDDAEALTETLRLLLRLRLREQLLALQRDEEPTNRVSWKGLSAMEQRHLREGLVALRQIQSGVGSRFATRAMA